MSAVKEATIAPAVRREIAAAAALAPSGDNMQPWRFVMTDAGLDVRRDPERDRGHYNVAGKADLFSIGAAIENACLRAGELGLEARVASFPDTADQDLVARIAFDASERSPDPLARAIAARTTNRMPYAREEVPAETWRRIKDLVGRDEVGLVGRERVLAELVLPLAVPDRLLMVIDGYRVHLRRAIRWTPEEVERTRDGLPLATLCLTWLEKNALRLLGSKFLSRVFASRASVKRGEGMLDRSGGLVAISLPSTSDADVVRCGRTFERLWLACTLEGLAFQPQMGLALMQMRVDLGAGGFTPAESAALSAASESVARAFGAAPGVRQGALARVGIAPACPARTVRRDLATILT